MLHHRSVGQVQNKNTNLCSHEFILQFFFDVVLNFRDRISTNQKQEFVVQNYQ